MEENNINMNQEPQQENDPQQTVAPQYPHDQPQFPQPPKARPKKRGVGGYVVVGAVCLLVGFSLGSLLTGIVSLGAKGLGGWGDMDSLPEIHGDFGDWEWEWEWGSKDPDQAQPQTTPQPEPTQAPTYTPREMPALDGVAPSLQAMPNPLPDIVESAGKGVVGMDVYYYDEELEQDVPMAYGSGFIISSEGYIVTNAHVVEGASRVDVKFIDGSSAPGQVIGADSKLDVAVVYVEAQGLTPLALGSSAQVKVGDFTVAIGNPTGEMLADTATFGIISATAREANVEGQVNSYIQTDAAINPGSSGGPLLDMSGKVIGITSAKALYAGYDEYGNMINAEGIGYAIPIDEAMEVVRELITTGHVKRPGIGISVVEIDQTTAEMYQVPQGILVYTVTEDGPAHVADLRINDVILSYDGITAGATTDFVAYVGAMEVGDQVKLRIWRDGQEQELYVTVGDLNQIGTKILNDEYADLLD
ncbi:MAG TPA: trypsin-like peptidase domain-containing protein [Candidatus Pelethousia gallinarum]|nr:trypsin-like peptidase domain-containing protein [Candidatus Pelethousia gallinarum]